MATTFLTANDDFREFAQTSRGSFVIDGLGGVDTISFNRSMLSEWTIKRNADGSVQVDTVSGASQELKATLINIEKITFGNGQTVIDLTTYFGPTVDPRYVGTAANDTFTGSTGTHSVSGGAGIDTLSLTQAQSAFALTRSGSTYNLKAKDNTSSYALAQVERVKFGDGSLALDVSGGNAGTTAKILGAVFGVAAVSNREYAGIGLKLLDSGISYEALMQLALDTALGANASPTAVVNLLYTNVVGTAPSAADRDYFVSLLNNKTYTPAGLGVMAADTDLNTTHINLAGLVETGLAFIPSA